MGNLKEIDTEEDRSHCAVCNLAAPHVCSVCKAVAYCGKEHQKQHWKEHKSICKLYEVKSNDELGRYLIASRDLSCNDTLVTEAPLVLGPRMFEPTPVCLGCYRPPVPGLRCPQCLWPICNPQCPGLQDPHHHSIECFILSLGKSIALQPGVLRYEIIIPLRCLLLQKRNQKKWQHLMSMEAHTSLRGPGTEVYKELDDMVVNYLIEHYLSKLDEGLNYSKDLLHKLCGILDVNALEISSSGNIPLLALYPTVCLMEHKCLPNTMYYYNSEHKIVLMPNTNIKKGEHLSTSYTHVLWGTQERREHLKQNKYFLCHCERCSDPTEFGTYLSALRCHGLEQNGTCGGWQLPISPLDENTEWKCDSCPVTLKSDEVRNLVQILTVETDSLIKEVSQLTASGSRIAHTRRDQMPGPLQLQLRHIWESQALASWKVGWAQNPNWLARPYQSVSDSKHTSKPSVDQVTDLLKKLQFFLHTHHYLCYETKHLLIQLYGHQTGYLHSELSTEQLQSKESICRDLLSVNKKLDPCFSRLSIYSSVLMYELQSALLELVDRKTIASSAVEEAKSLLTEMVNILKYEQNNTPGSDMRTLAKKTLYETGMKLKS